MQLSDIAQIKPGFTFRGALEPDKEGNIIVVQARNVVGGKNSIRAGDLLRISSQPPRTATYVLNGDIILVARGVGTGTFRAAVLELDIDDVNVLPSSSVFVIRVTDRNRVLPEYLSLFINSSEGQKLIFQTVSGSNIQTVSRTELEKIDIPIPPLITQKGIVDLSRNIRQQEQITERKKYLKQNIINATIKNLTHN
jgi:restriction endonuclease S subunit